MYRMGDNVVYGIHGVCTILCVEVKIVERQKIAYFVLEPLDQPGTRYYIPKDKPTAIAKLSPLLSGEEIALLLDEKNGIDDAWINDENRRKLRYRELISSSDRKALLSMVRALYTHKKEQEQLGKKFHQCDENFLRDAEKLLGSEFSFVLGLSFQETVSRIRE